MNRLFCLISVLFLLPTHLPADTILEAQSFVCQDLVGGRKIRTQLYERSFVTQFRGQPLQVKYMVNRARLSKSKDLSVVVPGLNRGAFHQKLQSLGEVGEQAISLELTNINETGPFLAPTPEEDAKLLDDLLMHLGFNKPAYRKKLYIINHSRGALVTGRFVRAYHRKYKFGGILMFNPFVGWIPTYYAQTRGEAMSSGLRAMQSMMEYLPALNLATGLAASFVEEITANAMLKVMRMYIDIHDQRSSHRALREVLHTDDEEVLEKIRQKLIGMENAEITEDFQLMKDLGIPVLIVRSDDDIIVPGGQIDEKAAEFGFPVLIFKNAGHLLPYDRTSETTDLAVQAIRNLQRRFVIAYGILVRADGE